MLEYEQELLYKCGSRGHKKDVKNDMWRDSLVICLMIERLHSQNLETS